MQKVEIQAMPRTIVGRASKTLRSKDILPAVIYGHNFKSLNIQVPLKAFKKAYAEAGESTLIYVKLDSESYPAIISDVAIDPRSDAFIHADFFKVKLDEKIKAKVPLVVVGESLAVKDLGGILIKNLNEIEVEGFPQDLPHELQVDISKLEKFGDHFQVKNLVISDKLKIEANPEEIIAVVQEPISEEKLKESLEASVAGVDDVEVIKKEAKEEEVAEDGAAPAPTEEKK